MNMYDFLYNLSCDLTNSINKLQFYVNIKTILFNKIFLYLYKLNVKRVL